jgi:eukaryotic-like serine/threonine-protein kinase
VLAIVAAVIALRNAQLVRLASERELQSQRLASFMLGDLADQLRPVGKLDLLDSIGQKGLELLGKARGEAESAQDVLQRARALIVIGEVNSSRGKNKIDIAVDALRRADQLLSSLGPQGGGLDIAVLAKTQGSGAFWLGQIAFDAGDYAEATRQMLRYRAACEHWLKARPNDAEARAELGLALGSLGAVASRQGDWAQVTRWFQSMLELKLAALTDKPDDEAATQAVAMARTWLGQMAYIRGKPREALALYEQAYAAQSTLLARHPEQMTHERDLAVLHLRRAETLRGLGRLGEATQQNVEAVRRYAQAVHGDATNRRWTIEALHAEAARLLTRAQAGYPVDAELPGLRRRLAEVEASLQGDFIWRAAQLQASVAEAHAAAKLGQWPRVEELTREAERGLDDLFTRRPHDGVGRELQARLTVLALQARAHAGSPRAWRTACELSLRTLEPVVHTGQQGVVLEAWQWARQCARAIEPSESDRHLLTAGGYVPQFRP